jgi:hypothetical protein
METTAYPTTTPARNRTAHLPPTRDYRDLALEDLADENAELRDENRHLVDLVADLTFENAVLRIVGERELLERIRGDLTITYLRHQAERPA